MELPKRPHQFRARKRRRRAKVPGGKALARIVYFRKQRGLPLAKRPKVAEHAPRAPKVAAAVSSDGRLFIKALRRKERLAPRRAAALPTWVELGPQSIPEGQTYGTGGNNRPPVSGRIASVAVDPLDRRRVLVASAGGGIWESTDHGATWQPLTDFEVTLSMGALAFAPSDARHVYAGTGEGDTWSPLGMGVLRSSDGGATWTLVGRDTFTGLAFYDIAVDPQDHRHLWAATTHGLYESTNAGTSWTRAWARQTWDLSISPDGRGELFAGCPNGLYRSTNSGSSWKKLPLVQAPSDFDRMEVCHAPSDPGVVYVFACAGKRSYLWRRGTAEDAFSREDLPSRLDASQGWYDWCAAVHPTNPDMVYFGAIELYRGVRRPTGSWKWQNISSRRSGDSIHPDQHHLFVSSAEPDTVYVANDGGLFRSPNTGDRWQALNAGLGITEFEYLAQHPTNSTWLIGGTQDNGTLSRRRKPLVWDHVADGDGGDCGVNDVSPAICYHSFYGMGFEVSTQGGQGGTWKYRDPAPERYQALFYPPLEVREDLVAQAGQSVFITEDRGASFDEVDLPRARGEQEIASALALPSADLVIVGAVSGNLYRIDRIAGAWQSAVKLTRPRNGYVSDILVDVADPSRVWVTYSTIEGGGHVYLSTDGGESWHDRGTKLPMIAVNAIAVDPTNQQSIYVGTDNGVYWSDDEGKTWVDFSNGLPNALIGDLLFHTKRRILRAGTRNRGVWQVDV